jgi:hypothetical protein
MGTHIRMVIEFTGSQDSSVGIAMGWMAGVRLSAEAQDSSPQRPERLWGPTSLISNK